MVAHQELSLDGPPWPTGCPWWNSCTDGPLKGERFGIFAAHPGGAEAERCGSS